MRTNKKYRLFATGLFLLCSAAIMAQPQQEMSSTSSLIQPTNTQEFSRRNVDGVMSSGSPYSPQAGEQEIVEPANAPGGPHRTPQNPLDPHLTPLGDALLPLLLCAGAFLIIRMARRKRANE